MRRPQLATTNATLVGRHSAMVAFLTTRTATSAIRIGAKNGQHNMKHSTKHLHSLRQSWTLPLIRLPVKPIFYKYPLDKQKTPKLTKQKILAIEKCELISIVEKINLIALLLGRKWITDIAIGLKNKSDIENLLSQLELPYAYNQYSYKTEKYEWIQVAINQPILDYVIKRRNQLSMIEAGVLYGYPISATLAYSGLLQKAWFDKSISEHFLSGVFSKSSTPEERAHFNRTWQSVTKCSNIIAKQAEKEFSEYQKSIKASSS